MMVSLHRLSRRRYTFPTLSDLSFILIRWQEFRDNEGRPVASVSLEFSLKDFVCQGILDSTEGAFENQLLGIPSYELCKDVNNALSLYRGRKKRSIGGGFTLPFR